MQHISKLTVLFALSLFVGACGANRKAAVPTAIERSIVILAVNDMHAAIDNFPRFAYMVDSLRTVYPDMLLISAGDNQTGNPVNDQYPEKGMPIIELMNAVKFDLCAVGNHDFDVKPDGFARIINRAEFDFICANLTTPGDKDFRITPYKIIRMPNGLKIAFVSLLHINSGGIPDTHPNNVSGFAFSEPFSVAKNYLPLKDSCNVLIYLNHLGFENDVQLANQLPAAKIDAIIGGHSHTKIDKEQLHNGILITQAERKLKYATLIRLLVKPDGSVERSMQLLTVNKGNERADIRAAVDKFNDNPNLKEQIALAEDDFTSYEQVGYLMADALRASTKADIALVNPGGVRIEHLPKGKVSILDVYSMDPFGNETVRFCLTGIELRSLLINAFELDEFLPIYPSGMHSRYTLTDGRNVKDVRLFMSDGTPLDMNKTYTVVMNNYMASVYKYEHKDPGIGLFMPTAESTIEYLRDLKRIPSYKNEKRTVIE